jgi:hypothetical protein
VWDGVNDRPPSIATGFDAHAFMRPMDVIGEGADRGGD